MSDAQSLNISDLTQSRDLAVAELLLSSASPTAFLEFMLAGGKEYLDAGVSEVIGATRVALGDVGVSWRDMLDVLRYGGEGVDKEGGMK